MKPMGMPQVVKNKLPEIPMFKGRGRGGPAPGGLAAGLGRGRGRGGPGLGAMGKLAGMGGVMKGLAEIVDKPLPGFVIPDKMADAPEEKKVEVEKKEEEKK
jgi:hypothetical protein